MSLKFRAGAVVAAFFALTAALRADVTLAPLFTSHAVLQRRAEVPVWGKAAAGERITVSFRTHTFTTTAGNDGRWRVVLPRMEAGAPAELVVSGNNTLRLADVVVGEVWLCGGQSNMAFRVEELEMPAVVADGDQPLVRHFGVGFAAAADPSETAPGTWKVATPATVGKFTATGYFYARELATRLGVPVGLVNASVGGTQIESWMSAEALAANPAFVIVNERWAAVMQDYPRLLAEYEVALAWWQNASGRERLAAAKQGRRKPTPPRSAAHRDAPSSLFNAMIHPLAPYALRGVIFDQGAANATRTDEYGALFRALIEDWRAHWHDDSMPFYFVQARNYRDPLSPGDNRAKLREAQASALTVPGTGMAVAIDIGASDDPHPRNKAEEGRRLALLARAKTYGEAVTFSGPVWREAVVDGSAVRVRFETFGHALEARSRPLAGFELAGADGRYFPASAKIDGTQVVVATPEVVAPRTVRYAWGDDPPCDLQSDAKLPAAPFRAEVRLP